jgi:hypothetical protein
VLLTENNVNRTPDGAVLRDPEVRQARKIADAARSRLVGCVAGPQEVVDLAETQRMLDKLREAQALAEDAEDRVLVHRGLLTPAEAERRAAAKPGRPGQPNAARRNRQGWRFLRARGAWPAACQRCRRPRGVWRPA